MRSRLTALVVEPDTRSRDRLARALRRRGYRVLATASRAEAFSVLDAESPHVLVAGDPGAQGTYRVTWLAHEGAADVTIAANRGGWRQFDLATPA